jgi:hypothetical protein
MSNALNYAVSIHPDIVDKPGAPTQYRLGKGWQAVELSEAEIAETVREGWALAPGISQRPPEDRQLYLRRIFGG